MAGVTVMLPAFFSFRSTSYTLGLEWRRIIKTGSRVLSLCYHSRGNMHSMV